ncbi:LAQU0S01e00628g1_1 [Lachancea quebecensis]|uniref:LAQU0S01e00628g1_1 n=1 Tax=Lachancea quebecensis TaxID=1654605 RepID=A0A0P1KLL4_9SACH|nr:LAQU0S01e00628g1_1 [Lachancea quebecensis]
MAANGGRRRTKPCSNCKKNKVKCLYQESLPCERCARHQLKCHFAENSSFKNETLSVFELNAGSPQVPMLNNPSTLGWSNTVENRLDTFENALESVLSILQSNQIQQQQQINLLQHRIRQSAHAYPGQSLPLNLELESLGELVGNLEVRDFRTAPVISKDQAAELVTIFSEKFAPRLFGYDIGSLETENLWNNSPLLLASICTVACAHHPNLPTAFNGLRKSLEFFASQVLVGEVKSHQVEHVILGLIIGALWLDSGQMFVSVAIQLARNHMIDQQWAAPSSFKSSSLQRLWYLLYIVDGNQNLIFRKSPSIHKHVEPSLQSARDNTIRGLLAPEIRRVLQENQNTKDRLVNQRQLQLLNEVDRRKISISGSALHDVRLLSQVEYHMAMESVFNSNSYFGIAAGDYTESLEASSALLDPSQFGVPWKSNLTLDKWMISWTITLQSIDFQSDPWCLKSTLLYYNFARMHLNTKPLLAGKKSTMNGNNDELVRVWHTSSDSDDTGPSLSDKLDASHEISLSAAYSLLRLATDDRDLKGIYQFLPIHVHVMLYYASLVLLNPASVGTHERPLHRRVVESRLKSVSKFKKLLSETPLSDTEFRNKLLKSLTEILNTYAERYAKVFLRHESGCSPCIEEVLDDEDSGQGEMKPRPILAWPGTNPGHP